MDNTYETLKAMHAAMTGVFNDTVEQASSALQADLTSPAITVPGKGLDARWTLSDDAQKAVLKGCLRDAYARAQSFVILTEMDNITPKNLGQRVAESAKAAEAHDAGALEALTAHIEITGYRALANEKGILGQVKWPDASKINARLGLGNPG